MKNLMLPYKGYGVYRFLDEYKRVIYIGMSDNINRRMTKEHFTKNGHLFKRGKDYSQVARVDIIKLEDPADTAGLELYLIDKYKPLWNKKDKRRSLTMLKYRDQDYYEQLEHWKPYIFIKQFDEDKIILSKKHGWIAVGFAYAVFISILVLNFIK